MTGLVGPADLDVPLRSRRSELAAELMFWWLEQTGTLPTPERALSALDVLGTQN